MPLSLTHRYDLLAIFNQSRFQFRHYTMGIYPFSRVEYRAMPVNRLFFPLENPGGEANVIGDKTHTYPLVPGRMYFVPAYLPALFLLDNRLTFLSLHTNLYLFSGVELFSHCPRMLDLPAPPEFEELLRLFCTPTEERFLTAIQAGSLALSIMARLLDCYQPEDFRHPLALRQYLHLTEYLAEKGSAATTVSDLARLCGESREGFTRRFKARTGITPKQLIDRFVTDRCVQLLDEGLSSKEITARLRFSSEYVFSRYFKRHMALSPRNWINRNALNGGV